MQILVHIEWGGSRPFTLTVEVSRRKWNGFKGLEFKCVCDFTVL